jgi:hypothetical protein
MSASIPTFLTAGWLGADATQKAFAARRPYLAAAAPDLVAADPPDGSPILLYKAFKDVLGDFPAYPAQQIGDCVGFGHGHGVDLLQCVEIALGAPAEYRETDTEFIYATSRQAAGILGRQDGSYGSAAVAAMTSVGLVSRDMLGADGAYSGDRAKRWGYTGVPAEIQGLAAAYKLGSAARVGSWDELTAALRNGYPVTICSSLGFTLQRDRDGFCAAKGTWGHCMVIAGVRFDRPGACILQSWGPNQPVGPTAMGQPSFSFWADRTAVERVLAQGDSWALAKAPAFVARALPPGWSYHQAA